MTLIKKQMQPIRIAQINAQNSRLVADELRKVLEEKRIDAIAIQEPYNREGEITGLGISTKIVSDLKRFSKTVKYTNVKSAIAVTNREIEVLKLTHLCNTHFTCVELAHTTAKCYLVSTYMQFSEPITRYLQHLDRILQALQGKELILCLDANATSALWHGRQLTQSRPTDQRGEDLEEFIHQHRLIVINKPDNPPTFDNIHGHSNIDVTLATKTIAKRISNWTVHTHHTNSDHNLITFEIASTTPATQPIANSRFNTKRADWDAYQTHLGTLLQQKHSQGNDVEPDAQLLSETIDNTILEAGNKAIPRKLVFGKSVPWWNPTLSALRKRVFEARHRLQRTKDETARKRLLKTFRHVRNTYSAKIKEAKQKSWEKFVKKEGNKNPWGIIYKLQTNRLKIDKAQSNIANNNTHTTTREETMKLLLNTLIPSDNRSNETDWHMRKRRETEETQDNMNEPPFTTKEIEEIVKNLNTNKAPGHDLIEAKMIKIAWPVMGTELVRLFNCALSQGTFPKQYKTAQVRVLLKGENKDPTDPKSYRPISLLPVIGKILEKAIAGRLKEIVHNNEKSSTRQYGFRPGRSTEDAIVELQRAVRSARGKYAIGLLFDISGAFDNVWWPSILGSLKDRNCPKNLYSLIRSYLSERRAILGTTQTIEKEVTKGCPQGSVLGPLFWNLIFDDAIDTVRTSGNEAIAFADDLIVVVNAETRLEMEKKGNEVTRKLTEWCERQKLELSTKKSEMILLKGFLDIRRPPTIRIGNTTIKMKPTVRYLGVHFGTRLNVTPHVNYITTKARSTFGKLVNLAKAHWGLDTKIITTIYKGLVLPILCYAAAGWASNLTVHHKRKLRSAQRLALLAITRAYRTTSSDALAMLAAQTPINIVLKERIAQYQLRKNLDIEIGNLNHRAANETISKDRTTKLKGRIHEEVLSMWQTEWSRSDRGSITRAFFPNIRSRLENKNARINHYTAQLLTGHGKINSKLYKHKITETDLCRCGQRDTVDHIIFHCREEEVERAKLMTNVSKEGVGWPCTLEELTKQSTLAHFSQFATEVMRKRATIYS